MEEQKKTRRVRRIVRTCDMRLAAPPEWVFPLLCPVREYEWIDGWDCEMIWSESGVAEDNCIFVTNFPGEEGEVWTVSRYAPEDGALEFVRVLKDERVVRYNITVRGDGDGGSSLTWTKIITSLGKRGEALLEAYGEAEHALQIKSLERMLNHSYTTGEKLPRSALSE